MKTPDVLRFNKSTKDKLCKSHYTVGKKKHINCGTEHLKLSSDVGGGFSRETEVFTATVLNMMV